MKRLVAVDLEATHFVPRWASIIEIGAALFENGEVRATFQRFVRTTSAIAPKITELTGITGHMLGTQGIELEHALRELVAFVGDAPLVAHNGIAFDFQCLDAACSGLPTPIALTNPLWDTLQLARSLDHRPLKLANLCARYAIRQLEHHRAVADAVACGQLFLKMLPLVSDATPTTVEALRAKRSRRKPFIDITSLATEDLADRLLALEGAASLIEKAIKCVKEELREQLAVRFDAGEDTELERPSGRVSMETRTSRAIDGEAVKALVAEGAITNADVLAMAKFELGRADKVLAPDLLTRVVRVNESATMRVRPSRDEKKGALVRATSFLAEYGLHVLQNDAADSAAEPDSEAERT